VSEEMSGDHFDRILVGDGTTANLRFPDPVAFGLGTFYGVRLGDQSRSRMAKNNPPCPPLSGGKHK
jgi:hypothetical protein